MNQAPITLPNLEAKNISWGVAKNLILQDINLKLYPNELVGIIGPNGAGKSSLLKILANIIQPKTGSLKLVGDDYQSLKPNFFAQQLAYLEQHAEVNWPLLVSKVIELGRLPFQATSTRLNARDQLAIDEAIKSTGVNNLIHRVISTLSEGEKMLVALTRALAGQTKMILADEPVAALDPHHQLLIMDLLFKLSREKDNFSSVIVLHDLSLAARFCDRLVLMHQGKIVSQGNMKEVLNTDNLNRYYKINADINYATKTIIPVSRIN